MRLAKLDGELDSQKLAVSIKSKDGKKLVSEGAILSSRLIERLIENGFNAVYIEDGNYDIELKETLDDKKRAIIYSKLQEVFIKLEKNEFDSMELLHFIRQEFLPNIKNEPVSIPADQVLDIDDDIQHSINVAVLAVRTAITLDFNKEKIELMAFIALLHDIGKIIKKKNVKLKVVPHFEVAFEFLKRKNCTVLTYMAIRFQDEFFDGSGRYMIDGKKQIDLAKILENMKGSTTSNIVAISQRAMKPTNMMD